MKLWSSPVVAALACVQALTFQVRIGDVVDVDGQNVLFLGKHLRTDSLAAQEEDKYVVETSDGVIHLLPPTSVPQLAAQTAQPLVVTAEQYSPDCTAYALMGGLRQLNAEGRISGPLAEILNDDRREEEFFNVVKRRVGASELHIVASREQREVANRWDGRASRLGLGSLISGVTGYVAGQLSTLNTMRRMSKDNPQISAREALLQEYGIAHENHDNAESALKALAAGHILLLDLDQGKSTVEQRYIDHTQHYERLVRRRGMAPQSWRTQGHSMLAVAQVRRGDEPPRALVLDSNNGLMHLYSLDEIRRGFRSGVSLTR